MVLFFLSSIWFRELCEPHEPYCPAGGTLIRTFVLEPYIIPTNLKEKKKKQLTSRWMPRFSKTQNVLVIFFFLIVYRVVSG